MNPKKFPLPTGMLLKTDDEEKFLPFQNPTTYKDITTCSRRLRYLCGKL